MRYILNLSIVFIPENRILSLLNDDNNSVSLSSPACRLLLELVKNNGSTLTRSWLLKTVWEDYGFVGSNSNLNNYIGELRKAFSSLDSQSEIIITIPKIGIKAEAKVEAILGDANNTIHIENNIHGSHNQLQQEVSHASESKNNEVFLENNILGDDNTIEQDIPATPIKINLRKTYLFVIFVAIALTATLLIQKTNFKNRLKITNEEHSFVFKDKMCTFYHLDEFNHLPVDKTIKNINIYMGELKISCDGGIKKDIYYQTTDGIDEISRFVFFAICPKNSEEDYDYKTCYTKVKTERVK
uniref:winged helix-turn-helix domain-containing protein n=1 Tax=Serratia proteamaculans TaxID=28151 RepID=UPI001F4BDB02|nr:winged helix-turn-helix domain-containing protein [Serratia proteamaculans]ULG16497.1 hypothetical protein 1137p_00100 [Serratia proteamaculans]